MQIIVKFHFFILPPLTDRIDICDYIKAAGEHIRNDEVQDVA